MKNNNKHTECHSTQLARNKTKGKKTNNKHPFPSPSIAENLVVFYFGWFGALKILFTISEMITGGVGAVPNTRLPLL
jgi:hypothetical protein